jgi:hypothetical protein
MKMSQSMNKGDVSSLYFLQIEFKSYIKQQH